MAPVTLALEAASPAPAPIRESWTREMLRFFLAR